MKKLLLLCITAFMLVLAACTSDSNVEEEVSESEEDTGSGAEAIDFSIMALPNSLDPHAANDGYSLYVMTNIYETLVKLNQDLELEPGLAESYEQISDTSWEFKLREGVKFHDGSDFNAEVVKANLDRVRDEEVASPLAFLFTEIDEVEIIDDYTVQIHTKEPFAALPAHLAHPGGHMISKEVIDADYAQMEEGGNPLTEVNRTPVGTGFFKFEDITEGEQISLVRNEEYWGEPAKPEGITFRAVPEDQSRIAELTSGTADIIYPMDPNDVEQVDANDGSEVQQRPSANMTYLGFNTEKEPFNDQNVRLAIASAIDKNAIIDNILVGIHEVAETPLNPTVHGYSENLDPIEYDLEQAKEYLADSDYPEGFTAEVVLNSRTHQDVATYMQQVLSEIGIDLEITLMEAGAYQEYTANGDHEMFMGGWGTVTLDADYGLYPMFHSDNIGAPGNRTRYQNDEVDELLDNARVEMDEETRLQMYEDAQQIIIDEQPLIPVFHTTLLTGINSELDGYYQYPSSFPYLKELE